MVFFDAPKISVDTTVQTTDKYVTFTITGNPNAHVEFYEKCDFCLYFGVKWSGYLDANGKATIKHTPNGYMWLGQKSANFAYKACYTHTFPIPDICSEYLYVLWKKPESIIPDVPATTTVSIAAIAVILIILYMIFKEK